MVIYVCDKCQKEFRSLNLFRNHLGRYIPCNVKIDSQYIKQEEINYKNALCNSIMEFVYEIKDLDKTDKDKKIKTLKSRLKRYKACVYICDDNKFNAKSEFLDLLSNISDILKLNSDIDIEE